MGSLRRRVDRLEAGRDETTPVPETPLMKEIREIDEEARRLDREIDELEAAGACAAAAEDGPAGMELDEKIRYLEAEIAEMQISAEGGSWEA